MNKGEGSESELPFLKEFSVNMVQAREEFSIERLTHSQSYLDATNSYLNDVRNFENAIGRLKDRGTTNGRTSKKRTRASSQISEEIGAET